MSGKAAKSALDDTQYDRGIGHPAQPAPQKVEKRERSADGDREVAPDDPVMPNGRGVLLAGVPLSTGDVVWRQRLPSSRLRDGDRFFPGSYDRLFLFPYFQALLSRPIQAVVELAFRLAVCLCRLEPDTLFVHVCANH